MPTPHAGSHGEPRGRLEDLRDDVDGNDLREELSAGSLRGPRLGVRHGVTESPREQTGS
jgi:hypothetical protein